MSALAAAWSEDQAIARKIAVRLEIEVVERLEDIGPGVIVLAVSAFPDELWAGWALLRNRKLSGRNSAVVCCTAAFWSLEQQTSLLLAGANRVLHFRAEHFEPALRQFFVRNEEELRRES